ncbi:MAG: hypothetical protein LUE93_07685 [Bacteroides sp.]|nr:hypothetical protein [Bacteroides sp.]
MKKLWFKSLLAGLVLSMGLVSCFDEKGADMDDQGKVATEGNVFASFNLAFGNSSVGGRADDTDKGLPTEYKVSAVRIILYETVSDKAVYVFDLDAKTKNDTSRLIAGNDVVEATAKDIEFVSTAKEVKNKTIIWWFLSMLLSNY